MLKQLISEIKTGLESVTNIKKVYSYPLDKDPLENPALIFFPETIDNSFETNVENFKIFSFKMFLVIDVTGITTKKVYEEILPDAYDGIVSYFDENWQMANIDGHRVWARVSSNLFSISIEQKSKRAYVEMTLQVKTLTDN